MGCPSRRNLDGLAHPTVDTSSGNQALLGPVGDRRRRSRRRHRHGSRERRRAAGGRAERPDVDDHVNPDRDRPDPDVDDNPDDHENKHADEDQDGNEDRDRGSTSCRWRGRVFRVLRQLQRCASSRGCAALPGRGRLSVWPRSRRGRRGLRVGGGPSQSQSDALGISDRLVLGAHRPGAWRAGRSAAAATDEAGDPACVRRTRCSPSVYRSGGLMPAWAVGHVDDGGHANRGSSPHGRGGRPPDLSRHDRPGHIPARAGRTW